MAAPARAQAIPSATMSFTAIGIPGWRSRDQGPLSDTSSHVLPGVCTGLLAPSAYVAMAGHAPKPAIRNGAAAARRKRRRALDGCPRALDGCPLGIAAHLSLRIVIS